jgi:hypothetical protein
MSYTVFHGYATKREVNAPSVIKAAMRYAYDYLSCSWQGNCTVVVRTDGKDFTFFWNREKLELTIAGSG